MSTGKAESPILFFTISKQQHGGFQISPGGQSGYAARSTIEEAFDYIRREWGVAELPDGWARQLTENTKQPELISVVDDSGFRQKNVKLEQLCQELQGKVTKAEEARDVATREFKRALVLMRYLRTLTTDPAVIAADHAAADAFLDEFKDVT